MRLFIDTADLDEIRQAVGLGVITGVTTNPTLLARNGARKVQAVIEDICGLLEGQPDASVSMECVSDDAAGMIREGRTFATWGQPVTVKVPFGVEGMKAVRALSDEGIRTNVTLVFSLNQVLLAANAGATFISSFVGRLDDIGFDGLEVIADAVRMMDDHDFESRILAASIRHPLHMVQCAQAGAHIATLPYKVLMQMYHHPLTAQGIDAFKADWEKLQADVALTA